MCKKIYRPIAILLTFLSTACSGLEENNSKPTDLEVLHGMTIKGDSLALLVRTNGCTLKEHFKLSFVEKGKKAELTVIRKKPDYCRKRTSVMEIQYSLEALSISQEKDIILKNPIRPFDGVRL